MLTKPCRKLYSLWLAVLILIPVGLAQGKVRPFLLSGQSNMNGFGLVSDVSIPQQSPSVVVWNAVGGRPSEWADLGPGFGVDSTRFGPEITLGEVLAEAFPEDTIALIKAAVAGSSLAVDWLPPSAGGPGIRYSQIDGWLEIAYRDWPVGVLPPLEGVFWMQGESDGADSVWAFAYQERLSALISDLRQARGDSLLPWVVGLIDSQAAWPHCGTIRFAQRKVAAAVPRVGLVDTKGLPTDKVHYLAEGQLELGRRLAWRWLVLNGYREDTSAIVDTTKVDSTGRDTAIVDTTEVDSTGRDTAIVDTTEVDSIGRDTAVVDTTKVDSTGRDTAIVDTTEVDSTGRDTAVVDSTREHQIPVSLHGRARTIPTFQTGTRLRWIRADGGGRVEWVQGRDPTPDSRLFRGGGVGILIAWLPDGRREIRRIPPLWRP